MTLHKLVHAFLKDRLGSAFRSPLGKLFDAPDFSNDAENQLRIAALIGFKGCNAIAMLGLDLASSPKHREGLEWCSKLTWTHEHLTLTVLHESLNVWNEKVWYAGCAFLNAQTVHNPKTREFFELAKQKPWNPPVEATGWRVKNGKYCCFEGNARLDALTLDVIEKGWDDSRHGVEMWVGREP